MHGAGAPPTPTPTPHKNLLSDMSCLLCMSRVLCSTSCGMAPFHEHSFRGQLCRIHRTLRTHGSICPRTHYVLHVAVAKRIGFSAAGTLEQERVFMEMIFDHVLKEELDSLWAQFPFFSSCSSPDLTLGGSIYLCRKGVWTLQNPRKWKFSTLHIKCQAKTREGFTYQMLP